MLIHKLFTYNATCSGSLVITRIDINIIMLSLVL